MLTAGKNVLCEKPMTLNYRDTKALVDLAREKNVFLQEVHVSSLSCLLFEKVARHPDFARPQNEKIQL